MAEINMRNNYKKTICSEHFKSKVNILCIMENHLLLLACIKNQQKRPLIFDLLAGIAILKAFPSEEKKPDLHSAI